jgi:hypothetical protein
VTCNGVSTLTLTTKTGVVNALWFRYDPIGALQFPRPEPYRARFWTRKVSSVAVVAERQVSVFKVAGVLIFGRQL